MVYFDVLVLISVRDYDDERENDCLEYDVCRIEGQAELKTLNSLDVDEL